MIGYIIVLIILWCYWILLCHPDFKSINYEDLKRKNKIKTGDLILFHALDNINPIIIGSYWGHIGIVWIDPDNPNTPYLLEAAPAKNMPILNHHNPNGIFLSRLEDRINRYSGFIAYKELDGNVSIESAQNFKKFIEYSFLNYSYQYNYFSNALYRGLGSKIEKKLNCGEMVFLALIALGVLSANHYNQSAFHHLLWMTRIKTTDLGDYLEPVYVTRSPFE